MALALAATCWLFTAVVIVQGQRWHNSPNHHRDRGFHDYDGAEDPNAVDDDFGWSWGAAQRPNANNNNVVGGRPQRQRPPTRSPNPAGARTPPPNPTTASQPPGNFESILDKINLYIANHFHVQVQLNPRRIHLVPHPSYILTSSTSACRSAEPQTNGIRCVEVTTMTTITWRSSTAPTVAVEVSKWLYGID